MEATDDEHAAAPAPAAAAVVATASPRRSAAAGGASDSDGGDPCSICLEDLSAPGALPQASLDRCSHRFHLSCITDWAAVTNLCPLCKARFKIIREVQQGAAVQPARAGLRERGAKVVRVATRNQSVEFSSSSESSEEEQRPAQRQRRRAQRQEQKEQEEQQEEEEEEDEEEEAPRRARRTRAATVGSRRMAVRAPAAAAAARTRSTRSRRVEEKEDEQDEEYVSGKSTSAGIGCVCVRLCPTPFLCFALSLCLFPAARPQRSRGSRCRTRCQQDER